MAQKKKYFSKTRPLCQDLSLTLKKKSIILLVRNSFFEVNRLHPFVRAKRWGEGGGDSGKKYSNLNRTPKAGTTHLEQKEKIKGLISSIHITPPCIYQFTTHDCVILTIKTNR